jgi:hypothetical protein
VLKELINPNLPPEFESLSHLVIDDESVALHFGGRERHLRMKADRIQPQRPDSLLREGRVLPESGPMDWEPFGGIAVRRSIRLLQSDPARVKVDLRFRLTNNARRGGARCPSLEWSMVLGPSLPFLHDPADGSHRICTTEELDRDDRQRRTLVLSFDSRRLDGAGNRLLSFEFEGATPHRLTLTSEEEGRRRVGAWFTTDLPPGASRSFSILLTFEVLLRKQVTKTVFLVARPDKDGSYWQAAVAAAMPWVERIEAGRNDACSGPGFRRFAPFLWFDRGKPLPNQVYRFLHEMPVLGRIIVFGEVLRDDLENLLTALLDQGGDAALRLQIFTGDEFYRDQINVLRGNIQARMIIADESTDRVRRLGEIMAVTVVTDPDLLPLALRRFLEHDSERDLVGRAPVHDPAAFLVPSEGPEARFLAAVAIPMARHLSAPVLLWDADTEHETLRHLSRQRIRRIFLVGRFRESDEILLRKMLSPQGAVADGPAANAPAALNHAAEAADLVVRIPYRDPVAASAALARLFRAHILLDWLVRAVLAEREQLAGASSKPLSHSTRRYLETIRGRVWADRLVPYLSDLAETGTPGDPLSVYHDAFIGRDEFVRSFQAHFLREADMANREARPGDLAALFPLWNDMAVLSDFDLGPTSGLNVFPAAGFAAYHEAPLLLFPSLPAEKEAYIDRQISSLERLFSQMSRRPTAPGDGPSHPATRDLIATAQMREAVDRGQDIARVVLPFEIQGTLHALNPLNIALFSTDARVPYEAISDRESFILLNYAVGRLAGTDDYETSLITARSMLSGEELQRQTERHALVCLANLPTQPLPGLEQERQDLVPLLRKEGFDVCVVYKEDEINKRNVQAQLAGEVHLFHFSGHGIEDAVLPQRSGIMFWDADNWAMDPLNSLEVKYHTKLGSHPIVFLNGCYGASQARINLSHAPGPERPSSELTPETVADAEGKEGETWRTSMSTDNTVRVMGISSSFIHSGAAAVVAPLWVIMDTTAVAFARHWYVYFLQGCSIGEASLLAKVKCIREMQPESDGPTIAPDYHLLSYVVWGDPTLRLYPARYLAENYPATVSELLEIKAVD